MVQINTQDHPSAVSGRRRSRDNPKPISDLKIMIFDRLSDIQIEKKKHDGLKVSGNAVQIGAIQCDFPFIFIACTRGVITSLGQVINMVEAEARSCEARVCNKKCVAGGADRTQCMNAGDLADQLRNSIVTHMGQPARTRIARKVTS